MAVGPAGKLQTAHVKASQKEWSNAITSWLLSNTGSLNPTFNCCVLVGLCLHPVSIKSGPLQARHGAQAECDVILDADHSII